MGTLETVTEIIEPQQSRRVDVALGGWHLDSQAIHFHCLKPCITPRIYLENAEGLLSSNHRISDLEHSSVFNLITLRGSKVEPPEAGAAQGRPCNLVLLPRSPSPLGPDSSSDPGWCHLYSHAWGRETTFSFLSQFCIDSLSQF